VFDAFKSASWEHSYAVMFGNGNGIARGDNNEHKDLYLYWSSEWVFGGKGGRRQGWKLYAWEQTGKRTIINENGTGDKADDFTKDYDRTRWGVGTTFRKSKYRAAFEYIAADGMIQNGTDGAAVADTTTNAVATGPNAGFTSTVSWNILPEEKADGMYLDFGYLVIPSLELDVRYDVLNRATDVATRERKFETYTIGAQYFFNKKTRMILNYEIRSAEAPGYADSAPQNQVLDSIDDRASLQVLAVF
jgi:predicted porin